MQNNPIVLVILDGFGHNEDKKHNAVLQANTPNLDELKNNYPHTLINASESDSYTISMLKAYQGMLRVLYTTK